MLEKKQGTIVRVENKRNRPKMATTYRGPSFEGKKKKAGIPWGCPSREDKRT